MSRVQALVDRFNSRKFGMTGDEFHIILRQANTIAFAKKMQYDPKEVEKETLRGINEWIRERYK